VLPKRALDGVPLVGGRHRDVALRCLRVVFASSCLIDRVLEGVLARAAAAVDRVFTTGSSSLVLAVRARWRGASARHAWWAARS
jgi:hypothetical protein